MVNGAPRKVLPRESIEKLPRGSIYHYIMSKSDILEINCSSISLLEKCISQDTEPLQGAYDKI